MKQLTGRFWNVPGGLAACALLIGMTLPSVAAPMGKPGIHRDLADEVRHRLIMLPYYSVFDNLAYEVRDNDTIVLSGDVVRPSLKSDAENVVRRIAGVEQVINDINVLPPSSFDDSIRVATFRRIYGASGFERYAIQVVPSIHIIVENGHVTLEGMVASQTDKDLAGIMANGVPNAFSVTNNLRVDQR